MLDICIYFEILPELGGLLFTSDGDLSWKEFNKLRAAGPTSRLSAVLFLLKGPRAGCTNHKLRQVYGAFLISTGLDENRTLYTETESLKKLEVGL